MACRARGAGAGADELAPTGIDAPKRGVGDLLNEQYWI